MPRCAECVALTAPAPVFAAADAWSTLVDAGPAQGRFHAEQDDVRGKGD
jgi:hypothetical protein